MNTSLRMSRWLLGMQRGLCEECKAELEHSLTQPSLTNARYTGAVLVRSQGDYNVMSLPDRVGIFAGKLVERDCQDFVRAVRAEKSQPPGDERTRVYCMVRDDVLKEPSKAREVLNAFKDDVLEDVRSVGPQLFLRTCADRYQALGQYTNAVGALREALLLDPKNARWHNTVAWMQATCPDASARNGTEAVAAATKACELTEWKNWMFVDTLAAAYAEAGDFKRAIEFQEQALRAGNPTKSEQEDMEERLSLYKQSQPFREKVANRQ
jgi:tetratricopeptide (TPR) repeat protein